MHLPFYGLRLQCIGAQQRNRRTTVEEFTLQLRTLRVANRTAEQKQISLANPASLSVVRETQDKLAELLQLLWAIPEQTKVDSGIDLPPTLLADILILIDKLATRSHVQLESAVVARFNELNVGKYQIDPLEE